MNAEPVIGVVGLGLLGRGIAACFLGRGFRVVALDRTETVVTHAEKALGQMLGEMVDFAGFPKGLRTEWASRCVFASDFAALADCKFVVESVTEDAATKAGVYDAVEAVVAATTVIASNSSAIPMTQLQSGRKHPKRFLAMHWAEPAHATRFMEIIPGAMTSEAALQTALALAWRLGKEPSVLRQEVPGFIVNRIAYAMYREAFNLVEADVADVETIDRSMRNAFGLWATVCGPFRWMDLTGGPELYAKAMQEVLPTLNNSPALPPMLKKLADSGARGVQNGRGFFNYTSEEARHWEEFYRHHAWRVAQMQNEYFPIYENPS